jgi:CBS domain-containing protein
MTPLVFSVPETATLAEASALMAYEGVHRLVVVGPDNAIVGIISSMDVLRWVARQSGYLFPMGPTDD